MEKMMPPISVLVIENDLEYRRTFKQALKKAKVPAKIISIKHGRKTKYWLERTNFLPDIIFLDLDSDALGPWSLLQQLRGSKRISNVPIIVFSESTYIDEIKETFDSGANLYVPKPVFSREQIKAVQTIFNGDWKTKLMNRNKNRYVINSTTETQATLGLYPS